MMRTILGAMTVLAGLLTQDASASAVFARQTGMACTSCHFQHFPLLNGFGRAFKSSGFTMMGAQGRVEGADLTIPNTLNLSVLATAGYEKSNRAKVSVLEKNSGDGLYYAPASGGELALSFGGRIGENAGFLGELGTGDAVGAYISAKMPIQFDLSSIASFGTRVGIVPFATDAQGASYGYEVLNTGANAVHTMSPAPGFNRAHSGAVSAQQYLGTDGAAKGLAFVLSNPNGFVNITRYDRTGIAGARFAAMGSTYLRVAGLIPLAGWEALAVGAQTWGGSSAVNDPAGLAPLVQAATQAYAADVQLQGHLNDMPLGIYASYARAPVIAANTATGHVGNAYNTYQTLDATGNLVTTTGIKEKSAVNIAAELGIVPNVFTLGAGLRRGTSGNGLSDNAVFLTGTYQMLQNIIWSLSYTNASGGYWYSNAAGNGTTDLIGKTTYTINLATVF
ncbi:MAG TPA: hypothetical protein VGD24_05375 [Gallionella sp.]